MRSERISEMSYFPPEYYECCNKNPVKKKGNWFCNKPLSPNAENIMDKELCVNLVDSLRLSKEDNVDLAYVRDNISQTENNKTDESPKNLQILPNIIIHPGTVSNSSENIQKIKPNQEEEESLSSDKSDDSIIDPDYAPDEQSEEDDAISSNESNRTGECYVEDSLNFVRNDKPSERAGSSNQRLHNPTGNTGEHSTPKGEVSNDLGILKQNGEVRKGNKKKDFCYFCEELVLNFARHIARNHASEMEVQRILNVPPKGLERKRLLDILRKKGNYLNSNNICKPVQRLRKAEHTLPCDNCLGFFSANLLWRHRNKCTGQKKKRHQSEAQNLLVADLRIDPQLRTTVFPTMRADNISLVAKKDALICAFGARYIKIHREKHFINVASRKMRELARLLVEVRKMDSSIRSLFDALKPKHFDLLIAATKIVARYNSEKDIFESPTYALNIGTSLKQCAELAIVFSLKRKHIAETVSSAEAEVDLKTLIKVIESQWQFEISNQASNDLHMNKWNKVTLVPLTSDLKILKDTLISKALSAITSLQLNEFNKNQYVTLLETVFCRVILLNRRRPGELQRLTLDVYEKSNRSETNYEEFSEVISPTEKILLNKFKRVVIRGKRCRGVPVLFSEDIQEHINILKKYRHNFVDKKNYYLFANPNSNGPICGYKVLKKYSFLSGAKNPKAITSTRLRKHLATITQLFSMSDNDLEQLAHFMGHTMGVHKGSYRLPDDVYQTAKISKLLLLMEKGEATEYKGKSLNEIDVDLEEDLMTISEAYEEPSANVPEPLEESTSSIQVENVEHLHPKKVKRQLIQWTTEQKNMVKSFFSNHIRTQTAAKKKECEELKNKHPDIFHNKDWLKIKVFVQNCYRKKK